MTDATRLGVHNTFAMLINMVEIGTFSFDGSFVSPGPTSTHVFDLIFAYPSIAGDTYTLEILATSTVPPLDLAWGWVPEGTVILSGPTAAPEPTTLVLFGTALACLALVHRRRAPRVETTVSRAWASAGGLKG
jgi:hypothetical protein